MPKRDSTSTPPKVKVQQNPGVITEVRKYRLITPLYGGGVEPEQHDPITVVRASEIRGHLRFWWRATRGGAYGGNLEAMRKAEEEIWGSAGGAGKAGPSQVSIVVSVKNKGTKETAFEVKRRERDGKPYTQPSPKIAKYAAFPLMPQKKGENGINETKTIGWKSKPVLLNVEFEVSFRYPEVYKMEVEAALWAWETFGGIGARTRRGFGALQRVDKDAPSLPYARNAKEWVVQATNKHVVKNGEWPAGVPHLSLDSRSYRTSQRKPNAISAWIHLIGKLQEFRQDKARYNKDTGEQNKYGMSHWPEANAIRQLFGRTPSLTVLNPEPEQWPSKFPRARFGLPIIFHMPHDKGLKGKKLSLEGIERNPNEKYDRLASPLVLRPLACADGAVGLALILEWEPLNEMDERYTPPGGLVLKGAPGNPHVESQLLPDEAKHIPVLNSQTDILQAFLDYLKGK